MESISRATEKQDGKRHYNQFCKRYSTNKGSSSPLRRGTKEITRGLSRSSEPFIADPSWTPISTQSTGGVPPKLGGNDRSSRATDLSPSLLHVKILGWDNMVQNDAKDVRVRTRPELLRLLGELTPLISCIEKMRDRGSLRSDDFNTVVQKLPSLRRLACKLRYRLSTYKATYEPGCHCKTMSESCAGIVKEPSFLENETIFCKFTGRLVPIIIATCYEVPTPWLMMRRELLVRTGGCAAPEHPLTYAHITEHHLPAIKCLLENYFWSNIDVSSIVQHSEFSCIVLYGKLVVGFGYMTPGTHQNEGYINFLFVRPHWRRCGIANSILYFMRQQCLYWSLTLHVSPESGALDLYHKFGFKVVSRIRNFYHDFVLSNTQTDHDALFMKLDSRTPQFY